MRRTRTSNVSLVFALLLTATACGTSRPCPPCNPELEIVKVKHPYPVVLVVELLPPLVLEEVPAIAPDDATPEEAKANALAIAEARDRNHTKLVARDASWTMKVSHHNSLAEDARRHEPE